MIVYDTCGIYIQSITDLKAKYTAITNLINALYLSATNGAGNQGKSEYSLDDGQIKIKTVYRSTQETLAAIDVLERQKQTILNQLNGRVTRGVDSKNLNRYRNGYY